MIIASPVANGKSIGSLRSTQATKADFLAILKWCPFWPLALLCSFLLPTETSFMVGSLRLTLTRVVLILAFFPSLARLLNGVAGRINAVDALVFSYTIWVAIVYGYHHGLDVALQSGGIGIVEVGGAYLITRAWVIKERDYRGVVGAICALLCLLAPFVLIESLSGYHIIKSIGSGHVFHSNIEQRWGMTRAYGPFDHPIHLGVIAGSMLGIVFMPVLPRLGQPRQPKIVMAGTVLAAISSMSSGGILILGIQAFLLIWNKITRDVQSRWKLLAALMVAAYVAIDLVSTRSALLVVLTAVTFSSWTATYRSMIFEWGMQNVWSNPVMGLGFNDWVRAAWAHSSSMDNFWLFQAVSFGIPGFLLTALPTVMLLSRNWSLCHDRRRQLRMGWTISMLGLVIAAATVHLWNNLIVYFAFLLGMGAWFHCNCNFQNKKIWTG